MVRVSAATRGPDKRSPVLLIPYGAAATRSFIWRFLHSVILARILFCPLPCLSLYVSGLSLALANKDDYSERLAAGLNGCSYLQYAGHGMAAAHVLMTASHWTDSGSVQYLPLYTCPPHTSLQSPD